MGVPLYAICYFSLGASNILCLTFVSLITMCLSYLGLFGFLDLVDYFLSHVGEIFSYYVFKYFLRSFLSSPSGTPIMWMLLSLRLPQRSLRLSFLLFILFSILFSGSDFHHSVFQVIYPFSCFSYSASGLSLFVCFLALLDAWRTFLASSPLFS